MFVLWTVMNNYIKKIEKIFTFFVYYVAPIATAILLFLYAKNYIIYRELTNVFANFWFTLLLILLFIKPLSVLPNTYFQAKKKSLVEIITYILKWWTKAPIFLYLWNIVRDSVYSLSLYGMRLRRQFGILTFWSIFLHFMLLEIQRYKADILLLANNQLRVIVWLIWLFALFIGFMTSNDFSVKRLRKYRKPLQRIAYVALIFALLHLVFLDWKESIWNIFLFIVYVLLKTYERKSSQLSFAKNICSQDKRICVVCGWIYDPALGDPDGGVAPGTAFEDIPEDRVCPLCKVGKKDFKKLVSKETVPQEKIYTSKIINRTMLTPDVLELTIETFEEFKSLPWQWASFHFKDDQGDFTRAYSIVDQDTDSEKTMLIFLVKLSSAGRGGAVLKSLCIWDMVDISGPHGVFVLQDTTNPKVFVATGTGLAPIYYMIKNSHTTKNTLFFSVSYFQDLFYEDKLKKLKNLDLHIHTTREKKHPEHINERIDLSKHSFDDNTEFYICGSPQVIQSTVQQLEKLWYGNIFSERFE